MTAEPAQSPIREQATPDLLATERVEALRLALLTWYDAEARDLPWRRTHDPYAIWISEAMLQQTQVATVESYWTAFLERFPTVADLAAADDDELLAAWSGLGYYRRARSLKAAAQVILREYGGRFPTHRHEVLALPGIGRYTAGAVLSIAFDLPEPLVDGNVARVFARLFALDAPLGSRLMEKALWDLAGMLVPIDGIGPWGPGSWNQGLMELGAVLCSPREPRCLLCPVSSFCQARLQGLERELPRPKVRPPSVEVELEVLLVRDDDRVLLQRRPDEGRMAGLWELPTRELASDAGRLWPTEYAHAGLQPHEELGKLSHGITVHRIKARVRRGELWTPGGALPVGGDLAWIHREQLAGLGLTGMARKILRRPFAGGWV
ncbi:A/G-specific adenine glycosylase [Engelhardtia mirabilis]|uniref:Adenine DNA glycosylase n=1 Tax=Engelhardtia mirabilis TaxID=2528011 RepID=A0A518BS66_9BACT|nr:putative A/G-specific adenine glycosylase YfhQ [Planctomycetes bacterium Pla133]QDV04137.1 putative A/G-specific adenine glycosylase YfhQ [Planctomycetes bacterium Pla86]